MQLDHTHHQAMPLARGLTMPSPAAVRLDWKAATIMPYARISMALPGLPEESTGLLVGPPGVSKSFLALQTAASIALGKDVWHLWTDGGDLEQGRVVVVSLEDAAAVTQSRMKDIAASVLTAEQLDTVAANVDFLVLTGKGFRLVKRDRKTKELLASDWMEWLTSYVLDGPPVRLVVIDTFSTALRGHAKENDADDMAAVIAVISDMCSTAGTTCVVLHHTRKASGDSAVDQSQLVQADTRGSGALVASTRWQATMSPMSAAAAKKRGLAEGAHTHWVKLEMTKVNHGKSMSPRWLYRDPDTGVLDGRQTIPVVTKMRNEAKPPVDNPSPRPAAVPMGDAAARRQRFRSN